MLPSGPFRTIWKFNRPYGSFRNLTFACTNASFRKVDLLWTENLAKSVSIAVELGHSAMTGTSLLVTAFSSKIRNLNEYYQHVTSSQQLPSGLNIVNTLRYFQQTLLGILRESQPTNLAPFMRLTSEPSRSILFPTLNYVGLYNALNNIIDIYPLVTTGQIALGNAILNTVQCLYLFLEKEQTEQLPYNLACLLSVYPPELYPDILRLLCNVLLPFTLLDETGNTYVTSSLPAIMMLVFQYCKDPRHHTWLVETLMPLRSELYKDILAVIAYGTSESRIPAANLLFHYWPLSKADIMDRRSTGYRIHAWAPTRCQQRNCSSGDENLSVKKCYCPVYCAEFGDVAPPLFLCNQCSKEVPDTLKASLHPYFQPLSTLVNICQNKECTSSNRLAVATCFSEECVRMNNYIPARLCERCHRERHAASHTYVDAIPPAWNCDSKTFADMICAIVSLLKETSVMLEEMEAEKVPKWLQKIENVDEEKMELSDDRRMLSRLGIRMLVHFCPPTKEAADDVIGRLLASVFLWFDTTAMLPSDSIGTSIEEVKSEFVHTWLRQVIENHHEVYLQCLLPEPPVYARVGGVWDRLSKKIDQLKEGLGKILALIPYDLICFETWERVMPQWFSVMSTEIPEADLVELKVLLSKIFEADLCSLPFPSERIYHFIEVRLQSSNLQEQESALGWLQLLTDVDIVIPLPILLSLMKMAAVNVLQVEPIFPATCVKTEMTSTDDHEAEELLSPFVPGTNPAHRQSVFCFNDNTNVVMFIIMLDILMRQMELSEFERNQGTQTDEAQVVLSVMTQIIRCPWHGVHYCKNAECDEYADCLFCRDSTVFFQLAVEVIQLLSPKPGTVPAERSSIRRRSGPATRQSLDAHRMSVNTGGDELRGDQQTLGAIRKRPSLMPLSRPSTVNATNCEVIVEEYPDEFVGVLPVEEPEVVTAEAVTIPDTEGVDCKVVTTTLMDVANPSSSFGTGQTSDDFLHTRQGKFRIRFEELPAELQLIHALMTTIEKHPDPDVKYYMLLMVKTLCLNCCALKNAQFEYRGFLIWAQENIFITKFWKLLQSQYSQISELCTCLIFHCLSLPSGADVFWSVVSADFTDNDFSTRFAAVEKVTVLSWFIDQRIIKSSLIIQGAVANAFIFLISSVRDYDTALAQRALLSLQTIKASSLRCLCLALEHQFDAVVEDRSLIMHQFLTLSSVLPDALVLNWDFFQSRFEVLSSEMQSHLATMGKLSIAGDLSLVDLGGSKRRPSLSQQLIDKSGQLRSIYRHLLETLSEQKRADDIERFKHSDFAKGDAKQQRPQPSEQVVTEEQCAIDLKDPSKTLERIRDMPQTFRFSADHMPNVDNKEQCAKESSRLVVALFMKFLSNPCTAFVNADEKASAKKQSSVLRHLNLLLGYNVQERSFAMPSSRLRASPIVNAFLFNLPKVLDGNVFFARQILPIASSLLLYLPSPDGKAALERRSSSTLWFLEPLARHSWLWSLLLILYKYPFDQPPINETVISLVDVVISTLHSQVHSCSKVQMNFSSASFRSANSSGAASCESLSTEWEDLSELPASATDGPKLSSSPLGSSTALPRKRKPAPKRQPTFDERDERNLEEASQLGYPQTMDDTDRSLTINVVHTSFDVEKPLESTEVFGSLKHDLSLHRGQTERAKTDVSESTETDVPTAVVHTTPSVAAVEAKCQSLAQDANGPVHPNAVALKPTVKTPENAETKPTCQTETAVRYPNASVEKATSSSSNASHKPFLTGQSRTGDSVIQCRCFNCNAVLEVCDEETISLGIVCLSTFIHRDPSMAAPYLLRMLVTVFRIASHVFHPWQENSHVFVPSNCRSVARQFVRIVLHQLAPNRLFASLFESDIMDPHFFKTVASCLADFQELNSVQVIQHLMEDLQDSPPTNTVCVLANLSDYMRHVPYDTFLPNWNIVVSGFDVFFRRLLTETSDIGLYVPHLLEIVNRLFRISNFCGIRAAPNLLDTCCKFVSRLLTCYSLSLENVVSLCTSCSRAFSKERDKYTLTRCCLNEFCQALKFKHTLNESNYMTVIKLILYDFGEPVDCDLDRMSYPTAAAECARPFLMDFIEFLQDYHVLNRMKNVARESGGLSQDTLGGDLKIGIAKYVAHEICRSISRDSRAIYRYLPWLSSPPAVTQLGANEFVECIGRVRLLSWILIGSLSCSSSAFSTAIPIDCSHRISDYIQFVLAGFAELSNQSVLNMSALFHAFHLCQLWTIYCEETVLHSCSSSSREEAIASVMDFWARITPAILQLLSHSKVLADMVNLHFLNAVEGLLEADSVVLTRLYSMWYPILAAYHSNIPSHLMVRLDFFENSVQSAAERDLSPWLKKIGFKIGQVELQSSAATQFYSV
uniref:Uncoordinated protein 79 n=1 Tax=Trichuris muris TaxID=70415 RepID=A0A5S6R432_TRIMR